MTPTVPPPAPCTMRERNRRNSESAYAKMMYAIAEAPRPIRRAGRRPYLSEKRPHIGALSSCAIANDAMSAPTTNPPAPIDFA